MLANERLCERAGSTAPGNVTFASIKDEVINKYVLEGLQQQDMAYQRILSCSCHGCMETWCVPAGPFPTFWTGTLEHIHVVRHSETYQGIIRPILVDLLRLTRKPTMGSVMASQARPTNMMMDA